jgi:hypothetical protein
MYRALPWIAVLLLAAASLSGCGEENGLIGESTPNNAPNTEVSATPPLLSGSSFQVEFSWIGSDLDGQVMGYEWRISNNGVDGIVDVGDTLTANLPWQFTTVTDSVFVVSAEMDSFPSDVADGNQTPQTYRYWQTHTFFVRSVDDHGGVDPSPAEVSFTATTLAPTVNITLPASVPSNSCRTASQVMTFGWKGNDPDSITGEPTDVRYLLIPAKQVNGNCLTQAIFEDPAGKNWITAADPNWSEWVPYGALDGSGLRVTLPRKDAGERFLFAVQTRDIAGAVTPTFRWNRNVRHVEVSSFIFPTLIVSEPFLGTVTAVNTGTIKPYDITPGQDLNFSWIATAEEYAGIIEAYRYGWDVTDPNNPNDPKWALPWGNGTAWRRASNRFDEGTHFFTVQTRDNSGTLSRITYILTVVQTPPLEDQRPLLFVDDWREINRPDPIDSQWDDEWMRMIDGRVDGFVKSTDVLESSVDTQILTFETVAKYRGVIWFSNPDEFSFFHRVLAPESRLTPRYNWLEVYQAKIGNIFMVGPGVAGNTVETFSQGWVYPLIFDASASPPLGFGTRLSPDGTRTNVGLERWPYTAWCLESVDRIRPAIGFVYGEHDRSGVKIRSKNCDGIHVAELTAEFRDSYPAAPEPPYSVRNLDPAPARKTQDSLYRVTAEEFFNVNGTSRTLSLFPRKCQTSMFRMVSRRDYEEWYEALHPLEDIPPLVPNDSLDCLPILRGSTPFNLAPIAIASTVYSEGKRVRGSQDFLWGFHPLNFELDDVQAALHWILGDNWELKLNVN